MSRAELLPERRARRALRRGAGSGWRWPGPTPSTLTNGRVIQADRAWFEGTQVRLREGRRRLRHPARLVRRVQTEAGQTLDPDLARGRERLSAGAPVEAVRLLRQVVARDPRSLPGLQALADAYIALGDPRSAREVAQRAVALDDPRRRARTSCWATPWPRSAITSARRARTSRASTSGPTRRWSASWPRSRRPPRTRTAARSFRLRYDGGVNEPLGVAVLEPLLDGLRRVLAAARDSGPTTPIDGRAADRSRRSRRAARPSGPRASTTARSASRCAGWTSPRPSCCPCCATSWRTRSWPRARAGTARPGSRKASRSGWKAAIPRAPTSSSRPLAQQRTLPSLLSLEGAVPHAGRPRSRSGLRGEPLGA